MHRIAATFAVLALAQMAWAAPFQNGSFEIGFPITTPQPCFVSLPLGSTNLTGWTVISGDIDWLAPACGAQSSTDGIATLDLVGDQAIGGIQQTFDTIAGHAYQVRFDLNGNFGGLPVIKPLTVTVAGDVHDYTFDTTGENAGNSSSFWTTKSFTFVATGASETIAFVSNTIGIGINAGAVIDNVRIINGLEPPTIAKSFGTVTMMVGESTLLSFTVHNPNKGLPLTGIGFSDVLPDGLSVSTPNALSGTCDGGSIAAAAGSGVVSLTDATLAGGASCTFSVSVTANAEGTKNNTTGPVTSVEGGAGNAATASVTVMARRCVAPTLNSGALPPGTVGVPYSFTVVASGDSPLTLSVSGLPAGLSFDPSSGSISGVPAAAGTSPVTIAASNGCEPSAVQRQSLTVLRSASTLSISASPNPAYFGQAIVIIVRAAGGPATPQGVVMLCARETSAFCPAPFDTVPPGTPASGIRAPLSAPLDASGRATFTLSGLFIDNYIFKASYAGDAAHDGASAGPIDEFVIKGILLAAPKVALVAPLRAASGVPLSIGVRVTPSAPAPMPTGVVRLYAGVDLVGSATLDGTGSTQFSIAAAATGTLPLHADYSGDALFPSAASPQSTVIISADAIAEIPALGNIGLALLAFALGALGARPLYQRARRL
jgi:choice-of-anchor C domain-containing protein